MAQRRDFELMISEDDEDVAYLRLPSHPGTKPFLVKRTVSLRDLLGDYEGPDINLDFNAKNVLIGIEIVG